MPETAYDRASQRVNETPALLPFRDICLYDWPEGDDHFEWIATGVIAEIVSWAEAIRSGEVGDSGCVA